MLKPANLIGSLLVLLVICASVSLGQTGTSGISGTVRDSNGAVVANATVTAKNEATNVSQNQNTTDAGLFAFPSLPVGVYTIAAEKTGFKTLQRTGNILEVGTPLTVDLTLEVGQVSETVNVQASTEQIQTANATIGNVVEQKAIEALPLNGRNPLALILYEPGVVQRSQGAAGSGVHVNGSRDRAFNVTIDGIDANESSVPNPVSNLYRLNPDNVQEYKVTTNNATAEEGRNSGASVSIATRPGTNDFHGNGFYFMRNEALNANEFFADAQGQPKPLIRLHQYGVEMGGPIKKNKTFFFGGIQLVKIFYTQAIDQAFGAVPIVYSPAALGGTFRFFRKDPTCVQNPATGAFSGNCFSIGNTVIVRNTPLLVDRNTGALAPGVRLCASASDTNCVTSYNIFANDPRARGLDPVAGALLKSFPAPNTYGFGDGLNTGGFFWNPPSQFKGPAIMGRIDHTFNQNNSIFGRYLWSKYDTTQGDFLNNRPQVFPGFPPLGEVFRATGNLALSYRRVISPRVVNEFTTGYSRFRFRFTFGESNPAFPNIPPFTFFNSSVPYLNIPRTFRAVTTPQALDNVSITSGAHLFRFGGAVRFYRHRDQRGLPGGSNLAPTVSFDPSIRPPASCTTLTPPTPPNCFPLPSASSLGISSTDFTALQGSVNDLLGIPARIQQNFLGNLNGDFFLPFQVGNQVTLHAVGTHLDQYNFYGQDEWKFRPNVTLNYGLRWEINPAPFTAGGNTFQPATPITGTPGPATPAVGAPGPVTFVKASRWYNRNNIGAIAPSFGLAWSPDWKNGLMRSLFGGNGKSVIRLGYRLAFDTISSFQATAVAGKVPGIVTLCSSVPGGTPTPNCTAEPDVRIGEAGFLSILPPPSSKPSSFVTPTLQLRTNAPAAIVFDPNLKIPTVHEWSLSIQRELPHGFVFQAAYIGRRGTRLFRAYDINEIEAAPILPSFLMLQANNNATNCLPSGATRDTTKPACVPPFPSSSIPLLAAGVTGIGASFVNSSTVQGQLNTNAAGAFAGRIEQTTLAFKLRPNQQFSTITYLDSGGDSYYHAAQFTLRRRFTSGLGLTMAYTFGRSIDDQSLDPVGAASGGGLSTTNSRTPITISNWRLERSRSDFDRTHVFTATSVWDVPLGRGKRFLSSAHGITNQILGGWSINGIFTAMSGEPFSVRSGVFTANNSHQSRAVWIDQSQRPTLQNVANVIGPVLWKDASGFAIPAPGSNGDGRNIFVAPPYWNLDLGFIKVIPLSERFKLQFRMEMFNALNHPNFDNPRDASVGSPSILSSVFAQTCCVTVAPVGAQSVLPLGESPRVIQFALKLQF